MDEAQNETQDEGLKDLFFDPEPEEYTIQTPNALFAFTIQGLSQFEIEAIGSEISKQVKLDKKSKEPVVIVNQGQFNQQLLLQGITRAACNGNIISWNDETVQKINAKIRDELIAVITNKSDGMDAFKKSSSTS